MPYNVFVLFYLFYFQIDECPVNEAADGFCLFEVFGQLERNMLPREKVADAMFRSSGRNARSTHSPKILKLTFKVNTCTIHVLHCNS